MASTSTNIDEVNVADISVEPPLPAENVRPAATTNPRSDDDFDEAESVQHFLVHIPKMIFCSGR
jgi:hypothetical protein